LEEMTTDVAEITACHASNSRPLQSVHFLSFSYFIPLIRPPPPHHLSFRSNGKPNKVSSLYGIINEFKRTWIFPKGKRCQQKVEHKELQIVRKNKLSLFMTIS
jgi:hypothetical protein